MKTAEVSDKEAMNETLNFKQASRQQHTAVIAAASFGLPLVIIYIALRPLFSNLMVSDTIFLVAMITLITLSLAPFIFERQQALVAQARSELQLDLSFTEAALLLQGREVEIAAASWRLQGNELVRSPA